MKIIEDLGQILVVLHTLLVIIEMPPHFLFYLFIYLFSHLSDAFIQSDLQMRTL